MEKEGRIYSDHLNLSKITNKLTSLALNFMSEKIITVLKHASSKAHFRLQTCVISQRNSETYVSIKFLPNPAISLKYTLFIEKTKTKTPNLPGQCLSF